MKRAYYFLTFVMIFAVFTNSCKKDKDSTSVTRIKTITTGAVSDTFTYDNQNRVLTQKGNGSYKTVYQYKGSDSIIILQVNLNTNDTTRSGYYLLNANGVATKESRTGFIYNYVYDVNNYKIYSNSFTISNTTDSFHITSGNVTQVVNLYSFPGLSYTRTVADFTLDSKTNTITNENNGKHFLGKSNANLITAEHNVSTYSSVCFFPPCAPPTVTEKNYSYTYEFDNHNRVVKQIKTDLSNSSTVVTTYTYY